jgi:hypothetical protein
MPVRRRRSRAWRVLRVVAAAVVLAMVPVTWSYVGYLTAAGDAPVSVRSVDWLRDHGFESVVNDVEQWWYTRKQPTGTHPPTADVPAPLRAATRLTPPVAASPAAGVAVATGPATATGAATTNGPGHWTWIAVPGLVSRPGSVQQTFIRPDPLHPSVGAAVVRFDQHAVRTVLVPGTREPGGAPWSWGSEIPRQQRPRAIAAFNAGFKFRHTRGGLYAEGRHAVRALQPGLASLVVRKDGTADVADWGRDARMGPGIASVRQNLALIVDHGRPVAGLVSDRGGNWGTRHSQFQYTWRSGVGVDAAGRLVYAAGSQLSLTELAGALVDAGAVRAMQLDIHDGVVTFNWYRPAPGSSDLVSGSKLMPSMQRSATRYLASDQRDFFTILAR